jgi:SAM-dependent methyltransferase
MESSVAPADTINKLRAAADAACAMQAGMELDLFTPLKDGPMTAGEIARAIGVKSDRLRLLLWALVAAGLLTEREGRFANTDEAKQYLVKGQPSYMGYLHATLANAWTVRLKTAASLRTGVPQDKLDFSNSPSSELEKFLRRINTKNIATTRSLLARHDFSTIKTLADVGCGGAGLAMTIAQTFSQLQVTAIDLAEITPITRKIVKEEGLAGRVEVVSADVVSGPLPGSYDAAILRGLIQVLSAKDARAAIKNIGAALKPGGRVFIIGYVLDNSRVSPSVAVGYNLNFINNFDAGEAYTESEHREWLSEAGFVDIERASYTLAGEMSLITARKPA